MTVSETTDKQGIKLTSDAAAKVRELLEAENESDMALRLGVTRSGCAGFAYDLFLDSKVDLTDFVSETDGVRVVVDSESLKMVAGATIDFQDKGMSGAGFNIENPNATGGCGCGNSFN